MKIDDFEFTPDEVKTVRLVDYDNAVWLELNNGRSAHIKRLEHETGRQTWNRVVDAITAERIRFEKEKTA